jgi:RNA-directed DNA polymerase
MSGPGDRASKPASSGNVNADALPYGGRPRDGSDESGLGRHSAPGSDEFGTLTRSVAREPGDLDVALPTMVCGEPAQEGYKPLAEPTIVERSDEAVVPKKPAKTRVTPVEQVEGRAKAKGKSAAENTSSTQRETEVLSFLQRIGERAKQKNKEKWTNLLSHIRTPLLAEAYQRLRRDAAVGVDEVTWEEYGERLDERLRDLEDRVHGGRYHPQPVRRVLIPKGDGKTRPLGIPALEDKIVQQAARMVLEPIWEAEFVGFSYGFRPKRSAHDALDSLAVAIHKKVSWVLDADIEAFFDTIDHRHLQAFIEHRIGDRRMVYLLMKWAKAGVMEEGKLHESQAGTPQGGLISPLLANLYLHYVLDLWAISWRKQHATGEMYVVRYADDFVIALQKEQDAVAIERVLTRRFADFGLKLHPQKTRVIEFGRFAGESRARRGLAKPETFDFLGFTHIAGKSREGKFQLKRRTSRKKRRAKLARLKEELERRRHDPVAEQHAYLSQVLTGHYRYYGVPTNSSGIDGFCRRVWAMWHRSLARRSQRRWPTARRQKFDERFPLPQPRIHHPWPDVRFALRRP